MKSSSHWDKSPKQSVEQECERRGRPAVVKGCVALLNGKPVDDELILALGGPSPEWVCTGEATGRGWARWVIRWKARGTAIAR